MANDRISEAYKGQLSTTMQINAKKRIEWIYEQVKGESILDVGCSQGIMPILLGRANKTVIGIDNDLESIRYAQSDLSKEDKKVQECVTFICDDFASYNFGGSKFDTVILGEVLEHILEPIVFLAKIKELLKDGGKLVVTVPFGINPHPDHKRTYYFLELYQQLNELFCVEDTHFMGKWIGMLATSKESKGSKSLVIDEVLLHRIENAFFDFNTIIMNETKNLKTQTTKTINELTQINLNNNKELQVKELEQKELQDKLQTLTIQANSLSKIKVELENDREVYKRKLADMQKEISLLEDRYQTLSNSKLGKIQIRYWKLSSRLRKKIKNIKNRCIVIAKKSPFLVNLVWNHRKKKVQKLKTNQSNKTDQSNKRCSIKKEDNKNRNAVQRRKQFEENTDTNFFQEIKEYINNIPISNGGRYYDVYDCKIGIIADEFLYQAFKDAAKFIFITPDNWEQVIEEIDFLLVVSPWRGLNEEWRGAANDNSQKRHLIYQIMDQCKEQDKKVVFYSKEDPPNYNNFVNIAKKADYIFTTCVEVVEDYKKDCNNPNVEVLPFGINPLYHNPVGMKNTYKKEGVIFSGSWMTKYPERLKDMHMLFRGVIEGHNPLKIIDRNYYYLNSEIYRYPQEYWPFVSPSIEHDVLQKVHKLYDWALNINTVTESMTMFANRGYELQAAGNILISNYSVGVNSKLPMIFTAIDKKEISSILNAYTPEELYRRQIDGIRSVMTGETAFDRVGNLITKSGFEINKKERTILVVAEKINEAIIEMFDRQSYPYKKLIEKKNFNQEELMQSDMVAFFNAEMNYEMFYLEDMANGFKYTDSDYITKDAYYDGESLIIGKEHDYTNKIKNKYCTLFWSSSFNAEQLKEFSDELSLENGYSIDHFNFNLKKLPVVKNKGEFKLSVIVPVYNNGRQLMGKAFSSLQRSSMFNDMEIILVDDGSTDKYTDKLVEYYERNYPNVRSFLFRDGGSGSASRPRNKGVELASCPYVTYLDPDNEAIYDGYAKLYKECIEGQYDIVIGDMLKLTTNMASANYYKNFTEKYGSDTIFDDAIGYMNKTRFSPMSIQAMVIKKEIIDRGHLLQPVGAAGQDTLFCWELLFNAQSVKIINTPIHIYYAAVEGSTVNSIGKKFFEKYYLIEKPKREALDKYGALDLYMKNRYSYYFKNWTLKKLSMVNSEEKEEAVKLVYRIHQIYEDVYLGDNKEINNFIKKCRDKEYNEAFEMIKMLFA